MRKLPTFQSLQCFEAAARHESYTRAAGELALTQGAVSRQIAGLESFLGVSLFRRTRHGVRLTEEGAAYARRISGRLDGWNAIRSMPWPDRVRGARSGWHRYRLSPRAG